MYKPEEGYKVLNMEYEDLKKMFILGYEEEGWSFAFDSIDPYYKIDKEGFFKGVIGDELVSTILALRYPGNFAHIGYFLVRKNHRNRNNGKVLFDKALEHCKGCVVGLFSVPNLIPFYQKKGFTISENIRFYSGKATKMDINLPILPYDEEKHYNDVVSYDKNCFPGDRKEFLKSWLTRPNIHSFVYYDKNNELKGYASIYKSNEEWDISPCCCDSKEIAKALIGSLVNHIDMQSEFGFSTTTANQAAIQLYDELSPIYNLEKYEHEFAKMYNGTPKAVDSQKCFCFISTAIG